MLESFTVNITDGCGSFFCCKSSCMKVSLGLCYGGKKRCVSVCVLERERDRESWQDGQGENAAADCDVSALFWHDYVTFLCRTPSCPERARGRESSINNAHWVLWGSSWWDVQWPKGDLFRPGLGASHYPAAFICLEVDGWSVFILVKYCNTGLSSCKWKRIQSPPYQTNWGL